MNGKNSSGRKVSLLNERDDISESNSPSYHSTPSLSPQTPPLARSDSSDSRIMASPSPITPDYASFDMALQNAPHSPNQAAQSQYPLPSADFYGMKDAQAPFYFPSHHQYSMPYGMAPVVAPLAQQPLAYPAPVSPTSERRSSTTSSKSGVKKTQYPCPLARQYNCSDVFTTSGHAARHAKKHTGKKDAFCPECGKAFTRKDNMEQHRRTHSTSRTAGSKGTDDVRAKKAKQPAAKKQQAESTKVVEPASPATSQDMQMSAPDMPLFDTRMPAPTAPMEQTFSRSFGSGYGGAPVGPYYYDTCGSTLSNLDTLAIAASGLKRKYDD